MAKGSRVIGRIHPVPGATLRSTPGGMVFEVTSRGLAQAMADPLELERPAWTLLKGERRAVATIRRQVAGRELRITVDGELLWSRLYRAGQEQALEEEARAKRQDFEALGWTVSGGA